MCSFQQLRRATAGGGAAAEIETAKRLLDSDTIILPEFGAIKQNALAGAEQTTRGEAMEEIGPVDYLVVGFPGNKFRGEIAPALSELVDAGTIRIIDIAFVGKDENGDTISMELTELDPDVQEGLETAGIEIGGLLNEEDLASAAADLPPNTSAALLVWENVWARKVAQAMRNAGGELIAFERLPHEIVQAAREWALAQATA